MKKILTVLLIVSLLMSLSVTAVFAENAQNNNPENTPAASGQPSESPVSVMTKASEQSQEMNQVINKFVEGRLEPAALKLKTTAQLQEQLQLTEECKLELQIMSQLYQNMSEAQKSQNTDAIEALKIQIRDTQKYNLQIRLETKIQSRLLIQDCTANGIPSEDEVAEAAEIISEL
ncbi:MAG: hypothetical protein JXQ23_13400 [Clostridia bacterium]|nr:hypothetical protein [Clostridia bacterium]